MAQFDSTLGAPGPISIPDHELLRLIGKGSYGEVWLARNIMGTYRAIKIIRREFFDDQTPFDREFAGIKKFEPISRTHSGFVDVLQIGRNDQAGCLYYVMEAADDLEHGQAIEPDSYIPRTLGKALGRVKRFSVDQCVQMGLALCQALDTLHKHHLVHRDIKPSNIVFINSVPKLADIGLVTESNNARSFVGTEGFIPPEGPGSERADIFSLGKALYEIASGRDRLDFPALPPQLAEFEDGEQFLELNECLLRACRIDPAKRYASAREMYEDLALLASGKSLRRLRVLERRWENAKRVTALAVGAALIATLLILPFVRERRHANEIRERQIGVRSANGIIKLDQGDLPGALREFSEIFHLQQGDANHFTVNQTRVASILACNPKLVDMAFLKGRVSSVELSPDGKRILAVERQKRVRLYDLATASDVIAPIESSLVIQASFSPQGDRAIIADEAGSASVWNLATGHSQTIEHPANVMCARFSPRGDLIATGCKDGVGRLWNSDSLELVFELRGHTGTMRSVAFNADGTLLVSTSIDGTARVWDVKSGRQVGEPFRHPSWVSDAAFSPDSSTIVTAGVDEWARVWKLNSRDPLPTLMKHDDIVTRVAFSPDGAMILTASNDATVRLWDGATTMPLSKNHVLRHSAGVLSAGFQSNGHQITTGCWDGSVRVWDLAGSELEPQLITGIVNDSGTKSAAVSNGVISVKNLSDPTAPALSFPVSEEVSYLALSSDGSALAAGLKKGPPNTIRIRIWPTTAIAESIEIFPNAGSLTGLQFSPDDSILAVRSETNKVTTTDLFDAVSGAPVPVPDSLRRNSFIAFHPTRRIVAIGTGQSVGVVNLDGGTNQLRREIPVDGNVRHLAFSHDGKRLLVCQTDEHINPKSAVLLDFKTGQQLGRQFWHRDGVVQGAFSPDGKRIVTAGEDRELLIWNESSDALPPLLHRNQLRGFSFSADGRWIGSVSLGGITRIWDSETGFPLTPPLNCEKSQSQLIFLPDRSRFVTIQSPLRSWLWTLPHSNLSPDDAVALSHLLNADLRSSGPSDTSQIAKSWSALKSKFPDLFKTDVDTALRWHTKQYRLAETRNLGFAMAFHADRLNLLESDTDDSSSTLANKSK